MLEKTNEEKSRMVSGKTDEAEKTEKVKKGNNRSKEMR